jgi:Zn-dependent protease with chaperone function
VATADELTCPTPAFVPKDLATPGPGYRRRVVWAFASLVGFIATYLALTSWFVWSAVRLFRAGLAGGRDDGFAFVAALPLTFFAIFMLKALFFRDRAPAARRVEIDAAREPALFAFLHRIADEAAAPRPHRVFLSAEVNAGVSYDLSIVNLLVPSKKNLTIGLGLINTLTLGEVRAVLAHEFGHFAQRAMAVGRWVVVAQRVAAHIVHKRDVLDRFLMVVSRIDLRVAWIGWALRLVVWALRAVLDTAFVVVVRAQRALGHEMERQADLVSVSLTGSDALVSALHKLGAADTAFDQALDVVGRRHAKGEDVADVFALQSRVIERARRVLADETHGAAPRLPAEGRAEYRVFERRIAHPPRMWSTHPPNREREDNIKRIYVPCETDDRSAWLLFADPEAVRAQVTEVLLAALPRPKGEVKKISTEDGLAAIDQAFDHTYFDPRFRGAYLGRSAVRGAEKVSGLYLPPEAAGALGLDALYPEELRGALERWKTLAAEVRALEGLERGVLQSGGADIQFRGEPLRRHDLPRTLAKVRAECVAARVALEERDREHRSAHLAAAERVGQGWPEYLRSLAALLHYADHTEADLIDARGYVANVFSVVTAGGRVSGSELERLAAACMEVHRAMKTMWEQRAEVRLPPEVAKALGVEAWSAALPTAYGLGPPNPSRMGDWLNVVDSWVEAFLGPVGALERSALEALLDAEAQVAAFAREPASVTPAPAPAATPATYATLPPGAERERQWRLGWWDRFQVADGFLASLARLVVSGTIVGGTIVFCASLGDSNLVIVNGLGRPVVVHVGDKTWTLPAFSRASAEGLTERRPHVVAETEAGQVIEAFDAPLGRSFEQYVYDVASAAPMVRWTAAYGRAEAEPPRNLGARRWSTTDATVLFEAPPENVSVPSGGGATRAVLAGLGDAAPDVALDKMPDEASRAEVVRVHASWDETDHPHTLEWLYRAKALPDFGAILAARLARAPHDVAALRAEQDQPDAAKKAAACARQTRLAAEAPDDADLEYAAIRCRPHGDARDEAFLAAAQKASSNPWLAIAAGYVYAQRADWRRAFASWMTAREYAGTPPAIWYDSARVARIVGADLDDELRKLTSSSAPLRHELALETEEELPSGAPAAYRHLAHGALADATRAVGDDAELRARITRLVGASRGATRADVAAALALPANVGVDHGTLWSAIGLALREKADAAPLLARAAELEDPEDRPFVEAFSRPSGLARDPAAARATLSHLDPYARGQAYALGCVILGDAAPEDWRRAARALLFAPERPFL